MLVLNLCEVIQSGHRVVQEEAVIVGSQHTLNADVSAPDRRASNAGEPSKASTSALQVQRYG